MAVQEATAIVTRNGASRFCNNSSNGTVFSSSFRDTATRPVRDPLWHAAAASVVRSAPRPQRKSYPSRFSAGTVSAVRFSVKGAEVAMLASGLAVFATADCGAMDHIQLAVAVQR